MRIAICDDEDQERLNIEALVKRYAPELSIVLFSSADELLAAAKTTFFPLIFLDIEMTAADLQSSLEPERGRTPIIISQFSSYSCQFLNQSASCNSHNKRRYRNAGPSTHQNQ